MVFCLPYPYAWGWDDTKLDKLLAEAKKGETRYLLHINEDKCTQCPKCGRWHVKEDECYFCDKEE